MSVSGTGATPYFYNERPEESESRKRSNDGECSSAKRGRIEQTFPDISKLPEGIVPKTILTPPAPNPQSLLKQRRKLQLDCMTIDTTITVNPAYPAPPILKSKRTFMNIEKDAMTQLTDLFKGLSIEEKEN